MTAWKIALMELNTQVSLAENAACLVVIAYSARTINAPIAETKF